jgi:hypothetical protein
VGFFSVIPRFMRVDTLSLLLSMANIGPYSDVLVVDMAGGLVVGAAAERLGGKLCLCLYYSHAPYYLHVHLVVSGLGGSQLIGVS